MYYHPCYLLRLIEVRAINIYQTEQLISILYLNHLAKNPPFSILMTLTLNIFRIEYKKGIVNIKSVQDMRSSSTFYLLYQKLAQTQKESAEYFKNFCLNFLNTKFLATIYSRIDTERLNAQSE
jgi:hypothetical protein